MYTHMKKEVLIAIMIGLSMGLIITYGVYRVKTAVVAPPVTDLEQAATPSAEAVVPTVISLSSPEDGLVLSENEVRVAGTTIPEAYVVIFTNNTDTITTADSSGNFSSTVSLEDGSNVIRVHVVNSQGETTIAERLVVVSTAFEELLEEDEAATESAEQTSDTTDS